MQELLELFQQLTPEEQEMAIQFAKDVTTGEAKDKYKEFEQWRNQKTLQQTQEQSNQ